MKKTIIIAVLLNVLVAACQYGSGVGEKKHTPEEFLNDTKTDPDKYADDKSIINRQLQHFLANHKQSFKSTEYFDSTELKIDTIIYNESFDKVSVFILARNPTSRQIMPDKSHNWYYDAYCYLGVRQSDTFNLKWLHPFSLSNFYNEEEAAKYLKEQYFTAFATLKDTSGAYAYKYNLDDKRFWETPIWKKYF